MTAMLLVAAALLGLLVGSMLNVVVHRLPIMARGPAASPTPFNLALPRSHCPHCLTPLRWRENVPIIAWVALRGRCAHCDAPIAKRYPLVELLAAATAAITAWRLGATPQLPAALVLTWGLLALAAIDWETQLLPDELTLPLLWLGLLVNCWGAFAAPGDAILGAAAGYGLLWLCAQIFQRFSGREGMGRGDVKLCAALGAWLGWQLVGPLIVVFSALGLIMGLMMLYWRGGNRHTPVPIGPCIALAGWLGLLEGDAWLRWSELEWALGAARGSIWPLA